MQPNENVFSTLPDRLAELASPGQANPFVLPYLNQGLMGRVLYYCIANNGVVITK